MADISNQIQNIRFQLKNMESQFENMVMLMQNMGNIGIHNFQSQIQNMGIQMLNMGIQMINIGMQFPNMGMDTLNIKQQIQNIGNQIKNIELQLNSNIGMEMNNNRGMEINNNIFNKPKIEVNFKTNSGKIVNLFFDYETTVSDIILTFLKRIEKPELFCKDQITFICNAIRLNHYDKTKIKDLCLKWNSYKLSIFVNDINNLIGG